MTTRRTFVIIGGGLAAAEAAKTLRSEGYEDRLVVVTEEPRAPYERPPLTKAYLRGEVAADTLLALPADAWAEGDTELRTGTRASALDLAGGRVLLEGGPAIAYDRLLLATGARAVRPPLDGIDRPWVHLLRTVEDADRLREAATASGSAVVAGGGWIAAEAAASLAQMGLAVTLAVPGGEVLESHLGPAIGRRFSALHERNGVRVRRRVRVAGIVDRGIRTDAGERLGGDLVVLGLGASPAIELAREAGLAVDDGIVTDEHLETPASGVFAAGDVASAWHPRYSTRMRSMHWDNARRQGRTAARNLLGRAEAYERVPYFFSDQFDLGMELVGVPARDAEVAVRPEGDGYLALWLVEGRAVASMHANVWDAKAPLARLVEAAAPVDRAAFEDPGRPLEATPAAIAGG